MTIPIPADWATIIAYQRIYTAMGLERGPVSSEEVLRRFKNPEGSTGRVYATGTFELARMIEKYEPHLAPVEPDVLAVRKIMAAIADANGSPSSAASWSSGALDDEAVFQAALTAYRQGKLS